MTHLEDELDTIERGWRASERRVRYVQVLWPLEYLLMPRRCLAHIVHLGAKHIVQAFTRGGPIMELEVPTDDLQADNGLAIGTEVDETSYVAGDSLGKLWAFINQVPCAVDLILMGQS